MAGEYGTSGAYLGTEGERYYAWQAQRGSVDGKLIAAKFQQFLKPSDHVLDFGCGGGWALKHLAADRKVGVEVNPAAREICGQNGILAYQWLDELPDQSVDVALSHHALEHIPSPVAALTALRQKIKRGGLLLLVVPIDDWRDQRSYDPNDRNHHLFTWTPQLLGNLLFEAGFDPTQASIRVANRAWFPYYYQAVRFLPGPVFIALSFLWAVVRRRREIMAVVYL